MAARTEMFCSEFIVAPSASKSPSFAISQALYFFASLDISEVLFPPMSSFPSAEIAHICPSALTTLLSLQEDFYSKLQHFGPQSYSGEGFFFFFKL